MRLLMLLLVLAPHTGVAQLPSRVEQKLNAKFHNLVSVGGFPSITVGIVRGDQLIYASAFGVTDRKTKQPARLDTMYKVGSVGKVFTASLLMMLRDRGSLRLDDPVEQYLPKGIRLQRDPRGATAITFRHLATHSSGLPEWPKEDPKVYDVDPSLTDTARFEGFTQDPLEFPIGERFRYSGDGYSLLGVTLERIGGDTYENLLWKNLFEPLGMKDTVITVRQDQRSRIPKHYAWDGSELPTDPTVLVRRWEIATSSHFSTVPDLARFLSFQLRGGEAGIAPISGGTLKEMQTPQRLQNNWSDAVGIGWWVEPNPDIGDIVWHKGGSRGFGAYVAFSKRYNVGVVLLANRNRNLEEVGRWLLVTVSKAIPPSTAPTREEAERFRQWRDWSAAAWAYGELSKNNPSDGQLWFKLADSLGRMNQCANAVSAYQRAIQLGENGADSWYEIARCDMKMGKEPDALAALRRAADAGFKDEDGDAMNDIVFESLWNRPEFQQFINRVNVPR